MSFSPQGATAPSGPGPPHYRGFTITDTPQSVGLLWTSDQPLPDNIHKTQTSTPPAEFDPAVPERERPHLQAFTARPLRAARRLLYE